MQWIPRTGLGPVDRALQSAVVQMSFHSMACGCDHGAHGVQFRIREMKEFFKKMSKNN